MVFTKLLLQNTLHIRPDNYEAASKLLFPKVARCITVPSSHYIRKCAARVLKRSAETNHNGTVYSGIVLRHNKSLITDFDRLSMKNKHICHKQNTMAYGASIKNSI